LRAELFRLHAEIEERHWWFVGRRRILQRVVHTLLPPDPRATVVDVGCGTGANLAALSRDYRCVGIDTSPEAIALARSRFPGVEFVCGAAPEDLGSVAGEADLFLLMDVLEHVEDDFALLSRLLAASRPGAQFLITVPADRSLWSEHDVSFGHYRRYEPERLSMLWRDLPIQVRLLSYFNARLYPIVRMARELSRRRGHAGGEAGTDLRLPPAPVNRLLTRVFAGESGVLLDQLAGGRGYSRGVSLLAVLQRGEGVITPRQRPPDAPADLAAAG
jgi:SAM-dependent methyltransferase